MPAALVEQSLADGPEIAQAGENDRARYHRVRRRTVALCEPLAVEDHVAQPIVDVSPPKWHLGHTTWFFHQFLLKPSGMNMDAGIAYLFNSYYEGAGERVQREMRGGHTRPTVQQVHAYRQLVDERMDHLIRGGLDHEQRAVLELGLAHEEQHQELLITDIKRILCQEPLFPVYGPFNEGSPVMDGGDVLSMPEGLYWIGAGDDGFSFDVERERHRYFLRPFNIRKDLVTQGQWLEFMADGGYTDHRLWHQEGWQWVRMNEVKAPMYWYERENGWHRFSLQGLVPVDPDLPVAHISYYEAHAFAEWSGARLPTEQEWEAASSRLRYGDRWEWTESAFLPYPGHQRPQGTIGEYNSKFMVGQMVLRGASVATPPGHSRPTYRNFFHPHLRWQYTGLRLVDK